MHHLLTQVRHFCFNGRMADAETPKMAELAIANPMADSKSGIQFPIRVSY